MPSASPEIASQPSPVPSPSAEGRGVLEALSAAETPALGMAGLLFFLFTELFDAFTHGQYDPRHVVAFAVGQLGFAALVVSGRSLALRPRAVQLTLASALLVFTGMQVRVNGLLYAYRRLPLASMQSILGWAEICAVVLLLAFAVRHRASVWARLALIAAMGALILAARFYVLKASPTPHIDVWTSSMRAVHYLLGLHNPYAGTYVDIYHGRYAYPASMPYLPGWLVWAGAWMKLVPGIQDVRLSLWVAEIITAAGLGILAWRQGASWTIAGLIAVAWLAIPAGLFITEQGWIDCLLTAAISAGLVALAFDRPLLAAGFFGFALATKQYAVVALAFLLLWGLRRLGWRRVLAVVGVSAAVALVVIAPFAITAPKGFFHNTFGIVSSYRPRTDSFNLMAYLAHLWRPSSTEALRAFYRPASVLVVVALAGALWLAWRDMKGPRASLARALGWAAGCQAVLLMLAGQAFCNYFSYLSFFALAALAAERWPPEAPDVATDARAPLASGQLGGS